MENIVVLTGAGISAESGLKTFRDEDGLWEGHEVTEVASPEGWRKNKQVVLEFYNQRRRQLKKAKPNAAHRALAKLEEQYEVTIITQNVDNLHERAGSTCVKHLHGELFKARSTVDPNLILDWRGDLCEGDHCRHGAQLRPHVVWFGEQVPMLAVATKIVQKADALLIIGTSMQVYPAAGLMNSAPNGISIYFIDPHPRISSGKNLHVLSENASTGVPKVVNKLMAD